MIWRLFLFAFALPLFATAAGPGEPESWSENNSTPRPAGAEIALETDRTEYWIGENVLVHFVVKNTGAEPFAISTGGDYRGAPRHLRFQVTAVDEQGREAEDP